ncbi:DegV family protein [Parablautia intestinalis]|jgi:DegV family protein with EDD domain|uniref:DegV family protein n=1 Tax=Parablautia intestinalis TaxID=2320100 RepID=UPI00256E9AAB|nr:DegV family protein [Parablautia intestinalis]MCI8614317.1 DegV family protein [Lachnospiraceae bacterium]
MNIQIITDSSSDITNISREDLTILPMKITFDEEEYLDGINLSHQEFYERLVECDALPTTSQIPPYEFGEAIRKVTGSGGTAIIITLSGKLSGTYQSACIAAKEFEGHAFVVDSENATVGERALVEYALQLKDTGMDPQAIVKKLDEDKKKIRLIALLDTLEYLKKGGRISKTAALAGNVLSIKPVVGVVDGEVVMLGKARGSKQGNNLLVQHIKTSGGIDFQKPYFLGYTGLSDTLMQKYITDSEALWKEHVESLPVATVGGTIGTHVGPGAIAVAYFALS